MTPPRLGLSRHKDGPAPDPALDDAELAAARDSLLRGRWSDVRTLLSRTGEDWDRRGHRVVVLAEHPACATWAQEWRLAEPDSADAVTLLGVATVFLAVRGRATPSAAREICQAAARMAPKDPTPWLGTLIMARRTGTDDERARAFDQVRARHRDHHHAHHLMVACLAEHQSGDADDPLHEVYDFASWAAEQAPADSPLAVLPVIAHTERYRVLAGAGLLPSDPAACGHWSTRRARQVMKAAFDWWLEWDGEDVRHPRHKIDLNYLAHAKYLEGRLPEAAALISRIGGHVTHAPWSYPDRDPKKAFRAARDAALGAH
ncbi:hypothetical protein POF50_020005 [Streptomyces sp. SL13]|jgi:hypothetical protein|uniref:DUF4034 domain-containing protein n=1 Tax=Streptantibioticus silvisoli TaxID=2705255 RepID=A0AA90HB99_9ACTN|nr:hypothetical protein [Streptantibioticus silvisoli]MDI5966246.1 hypothetical protein [Streptantibioticus silvisoli]MDI5971587.1 hypothetical protein [Streptantibioticus silvisoli]